MKMTDAVEKGFKLNRDLVNPNFEGYKLSLDPIPSYKVSLSSCPDELKLQENQFSYQHVKAFAVHNHLFLDPYNPNCVFYISDLKLMQIHVENGHSISNAEIVFEFPVSSNQRQSTNRLHSCVCFMSRDWLSLSDGVGNLYLVWTGNRTDGLTWKVCYRCRPLEDEASFILKESIMFENGGNHCVDFILLHVEKVDKNDSDSKFQTVVEWLSVVNSADKDHWELYRTRRLTGAAPVDYISLQTNGKAIYVASEKPFKMTYDSLKPITIEERNIEKSDKKERSVYKWHQTAEDLTVYFNLPRAYQKTEVKFKLVPDYIELSVDDDEMEPLLNGKLFNSVDVEASTWTIQNNRLELILGKKSETLWTTVVEGDERGQLVENTETSDRMEEDDENEDDDKKPYNAQELEDCDNFPDESSALVRIDGETHVKTHQADLASHQWLFNTRLSNQKTCALCLRHDVDGIVWQPQDNVDIVESPWIHVGTFNALGYVKASKTQNKFTTCSPDLSFAVLCDCVRHVYVYRQSSPTLTPLRNRKTGKSVSAIAKQQLVTLECTDTILGMQATNDRIYILTAKHLYMIQVNEQSL
ncbi:nudC domain-containing protein 1-like [Tubulanus polymorphus]|uniref:nudC domain-containing protein 1-like n=1 Tax=Tubulanus polymorphus TaxID=672921 RepID=UPI003DA6BF2B